jgi:YD repeat-containing protein
MALRTTDGTQLTYKPKGTAYECTEIKDRNGNYITINYNSSGRMANIHDTLDRVISFNYDTSNNLTSITQGWTVNGQAQTHNWAVFAYRNPDLTIQTNFPGLTVLGPSTIKPLEKVTLSDGSVFNFDYTSWGQVRKISNVASDGLTLLNYRSYNLPIDASSSASDCPRFTERHDWAAYWNGDTDATASTSEEAVTTYDILWNQTWTMPDNTSASGTVAQVGLKLNPTTYVSYDKIYFIGTAGNTTNGWQRGLPSLVRTYDEANGLQRQVQTTWVQDSGASYIINPRVAETNIYDSANNRKRTSISYQTATFNDGTSYRLPQDVYEYQADASTVLRRSHTDYNLATSYRTQWIIGCRVNRCFTK